MVRSTGRLKHHNLSSTFTTSRADKSNSFFIMHLISIIVATLFATSSIAAPNAPKPANVAKPAELNPWEVMSTLKKAPGGHTHIADDGVIRTYDANDKVIDHTPLSNNQLKQLLANLPDAWKKESKHLHELFDNVDGHAVKDKRQLLDPPKWLRREIDRSNIITPNPEVLEKRRLVPRDWFCVGQPCTNDDACRFLGCSGCAYLDQVLPGGGGVCIP